MKKDVNYTNRFNQGIWIKERRDDIQYYYHSRQLVCQKIPEAPIWSAMPLTSIWLVKAVGTPGFHGWFVIAGDHPTDITGMGGLSGAQDVLYYFATKWKRAAEHLIAGESVSDFRINNIEDRPRFGRVIKERAFQLEHIADNFE